MDMDDWSFQFENSPLGLASQTCDLDGLSASLTQRGNPDNEVVDPPLNFSVEEIMENLCPSTGPTLSSLTSTVGESFLAFGPMQGDCLGAQFLWPVEPTSYFPNPVAKTTSMSAISEGSILTSTEPPEGASDIHSDRRDGRETDIFGSFSVDELSRLLAQSPEQNTEAVTNDSLPHVPSTPYGVVGPEPLIGGSTEKLCASSVSQESWSMVRPGAENNDLFDALGLGFRSQQPFNSPEGCSVPEIASGSEMGTKKGLFSELGLKELLTSFSSSSCVTRFGVEDNVSSAKRRKVENPYPDFKHVASSSFSCADFSKPLHGSLFKNEFLANSQGSRWTDDSYSMNIGDGVLPKSKKPEEPMKVTKKRAKPGDSNRPRPKDRQMIQDRIKELRKIIPNGAKCSIDALLDRTIKHMVFLQGVEKHADKLRRSREPKLMNQHDEGLPMEERAGNAGATWACEVGDQTLFCPIIVEDLSPPGTMLIEMLCEDHGYFLEIADTIKGFGLNILNGVMEVRGSKIWAHFTVEAKRQVTRLEIFWSLVQLLQQTDSANCADSTSQSFDAQKHLSACPVGLAGSLQ